MRRLITLIAFCAVLLTVAPWAEAGHQVRAICPDAWMLFGWDAPDALPAECRPIIVQDYIDAWEELQPVHHAPWEV